MQDKTESLNRLITGKGNELVIRNFLTKKSPGPDSFTSELNQTFKAELTPVRLKLFHKI